MAQNEQITDITDPDPGIMQSGLASILRLCQAGRQCSLVSAPIALEGIEEIAAFCLMSIDELTQYEKNGTMQ